MNDLTLVIPAKNESESLPAVLDELSKFNVKKIIVMSENDLDTFNSIKKYNEQIVYQKGKGFGNALRTGINSVETQFFCVFNADGSFNPIDLEALRKKLLDGADFVFSSRYLKDGGSDDDTVITYIGNFLFTNLCNILFRLNNENSLNTCGVIRKKFFGENKDASKWFLELL